MSGETKARRPDELRDAIDRGEGADKVDYPDPAAAPLGTDEEAGGNPSSAAATETAFRQEIRDTPKESPRAAGSRGLVVGLTAAFAVAALVLLALVAWAAG